MKTTKAVKVEVIRTETVVEELNRLFEKLIIIAMPEIAE
jgi:hypothetical protein